MKPDPDSDIPQTIFKLFEIVFLHLGSNALDIFESFLNQGCQNMCVRKAGVTCSVFWKLVLKLDYLSVRWHASPELV